MMQEEGQSHGQGMYAYYLVHLWERLFLVPLWIVRMTKYKSIGALTEFLTSQSVSWVYCWDFSEWMNHIPGYRPVFSKQLFMFYDWPWSFTFSYLDLTVSTKVLLSVDGCQIIIVERGIQTRTSYLAILLMSLQVFLS